VITHPVIEKWYDDWQSKRHAGVFDFRSSLSDTDLSRSYESLNEIFLFRQRLVPSTALTFLEAGCATAELYRYLRLNYPNIKYYGFDISRPAIERAREKYPAANLFLVDPHATPGEYLGAVGLPGGADIVFAKDVVHHQTRSLEFVTKLLEMTNVALLMRCRTRDVGQTQSDPELSCQYHYGGWMPYIVSNLEELIQHILGQRPRSEVVVYRNHMVLGGKQGRFLPKECYLPETGTAETSIGVFIKTTVPGKVTIEDRTDQTPSYTLTHQCRSALRFIFRAIRRPSSGGL
jgi:SAM-dependent methyltransferase